MVSNPVSDARRAGLGIASLIAAGLGGAEALLDGDQVPRGQRPDPPGAARHVIGRLLDLSHVSWRTCVADLLADHKRTNAGAELCLVPSTLPRPARLPGQMDGHAGHQAARAFGLGPLAYVVCCPACARTVQVAMCCPAQSAWRNRPLATLEPRIRTLPCTARPVTGTALGRPRPALPTGAAVQLRRSANGKSWTSGAPPGNLRFSRRLHLPCC
jgi:hypothetical protein